MAADRIERRLVAILAADVVGFTRLMETNEERTLADLLAHRSDVLVPAVEKHGGRIFKEMGDGFLIEFGSTLGAARCALEIQRSMAARNRDQPQERSIRFRIGLNVGDLIVDRDDFYGDGVNLAARLEGIAPPGGICCTADVRNQIGNRLDAAFLDMGEKALKHIGQPVHVFQIDIQSLVGSDVPDHRNMLSAKPAIAVLPFVNMSDDAGQEYFSDGITEDIITDLSNVSGLFVLGRNTVFALKGRAVSLVQTARELGVSHILEGSVRRAGNKVRVNAQLIDGATGGHLWAARYDRELNDIFIVQDELTEAIVEQLKVKLLPQERKAISKAHPETPEAYTFYLKGRDLFRKVTRPNLLSAREMFEKAAAIDPSYSLAIAGLADCLSFLVWHYAEDIPAGIILKHADRALALNPDLAEAHASRGLANFLNNDFGNAEDDLRRAISLNPGLYEAHHFLALISYTLRKFERAAEHYERAAEIDPDDFQSLSLLQQAYRSLGLDELALGAARRALVRAMRAASQNPDNPRPLYHAANAMVTLGRVAEARQFTAKAIGLDPDDFLTRYNVACLSSLLGDLDAAIALLVELLPRAPAATKIWVRHETDFLPLHAHPRWDEVLELTR